MPTTTKYIECYSNGNDAEYEFITDLANKLETSEAHIVLIMRNLAIEHLLKRDENGVVIPCTEDEWYERFRREM